MSLQLAHRDLGGEGKPPLILLHGLLGSSRNWQTVGADLAAQHHVCALDQRNHGRSPHDREMNYPVMVDDVLRWLDERKWNEVALLGHSMGGKVAMALACRFPQRVSRLVVVDIVPKTYLSEAHRAEFAAMNELDLRSLKSRGEAELKFEGRVADWAMRKFLATNLERREAGENAAVKENAAAGGGEATGWRWAINLPALTQSLPVLEANPLSENDRFEKPTLLIKGGKSRYIEAADFEPFRRHFPNSRQLILEKSGHNPHMETRAEFAAAVLSFLA
ncbi:MAG TPA: alpha/beta fold hydrolase [Opitutaceae bacterium]|nr:alpha/beta fold hydrolase [Opitutaceae bacterium]